MALDEAPAEAVAGSNIARYRTAAMHLDKIGPPEGPQYLAPPEWTMQVHREGAMFTAVVMVRLQPMCRLSIAATGLDDDAARTALANKARHWIHGYLSRQPGKG